MNAMLIKVTFTTHYEEGIERKLISRGFSKLNEAVYEKRVNGYRLTFSQRRNFKISELTIYKEQQEETLRYVDLLPFPFKEGWNLLWEKEGNPVSVEVLLPVVSYEGLQQNGWTKLEYIKDTVSYQSEDTEASIFRHYEPNSKKEYFRFVDELSLPSGRYLERIKDLGLA